jgi:hypothetical protein
MGKKGTGSALVAYIRRMHKAEADIQNIETQTAQAIFADLENLPEDQEYVCMDCGDVLGGCKCEHLQAIKRKYLSNMQKERKLDNTTSVVSKFIEKEASASTRLDGETQS